MTLIILNPCSNGRTEVQCDECRHLFWLTSDEIKNWHMCPHCLGWWTL